MKDIFIYHYKQKENARLSRMLFDIIMCERDMMSHFGVFVLMLIAASRFKKQIYSTLPRMQRICRRLRQTHD